jgi:hypothetical protein
MVIIYINIFHSKALQKLTQIAIYGLKTNYLATLLAILFLFTMFLRFKDILIFAKCMRLDTSKSKSTVCQGDQMSFVKKIGQKVAEPIFCENLNVGNVCLHARMYISHQITLY